MESTNYKLLASAWALRCARRQGQKVYRATTGWNMSLSTWEYLLRAGACFEWKESDWVDFKTLERLGRLQWEGVCKLVRSRLLSRSPAGPEHRSGKPGRPVVDVYSLTPLGRACIDAYLGVLLGPPIDQIGDVVGKMEREKQARRATA